MKSFYSLGLLSALLVTLPLASAEKAAEFAPLPVAVSSFGAAQADGYVYLYGGHSGKTHQYSTASVSNQFLRLKISEPREWEALEGRTGLQGLAMVAHRGMIYRIGGMQPRNAPGEKSDNASVASVDRYDPKAKKWESLPPMPEGRSSHDAVVLGEKLYVVGGWQMMGAGKQAVWQRNALVMDLAQAKLKWESIPQPFQRRALTAASFRGKLYVLCGLTSDGELDRSVDILDPATGKWSSGPEVPAPIGNGFTPAAGVVGDRLCLSTGDGKIFRLGEKGERWDEIGKLEQPRFVHRLIPIDDRRLLALGGASKMGNVVLTEVVDGGAAVVPAPKKTNLPGEQEFCPIMTSVPVGSDSKIVEYKGTKILICCSTCVKKWNADPEAYLIAKLLPQLDGKDLPTRSLAQIYCPVYKDRVVSEKDPFVMHQGVKIHLFNESAVKKFQAAPEQYLDVSILPQIKEVRK